LKIVKGHVLAEYVLASGRPGAENVSDFLNRRPGAGSRRALEQDHEVVVALARNLAPAPRAGQNNGRVVIDLDRCEPLAAFEKSAVGLSPGGRHVLKSNAGRPFQAGDAVGGTHI
jgi:hypothetical protein